MSEETVKGAVHGVLAVLFGIPFGYNAMRLCVAPKPRHVVNLALYGTAIAWELVQARHHWRQA